MDCQKLLAGLTDRDKLDLAARLTQAALSSQQFERSCHFDHEENRDVVDLTYSVFCEMLKMLDAAPSPEKILPLQETQKESRERERLLQDTRRRQ